MDRKTYQDRVPLLRAQLAARHAEPVSWSRERIAAAELNLGTALYQGFGDVEGACAAFLASMDASPSMMALRNLEVVARRAGNASLEHRAAALRALLFPDGVPKSPQAPAARNGKRELAIYTGYSPPFTGANFGERRVFGSEIAAVKLAEALAGEGTYAVTVFCPCNGEEEPAGCNGVRYLHLSQYDAWSRVHAVDTLIVSRYMHFFLEFEPRARQVTAWLHDLAPHYLWTDRALPAQGSTFFANILPRLDRVVCLSPWHAGALVEWMRAQRCTEEALALAASKIMVAGDAIDPATLAPPDTRRVAGRLVFCSDPDRGLAPLLAIFREIRRRVPQATLHVYWPQLASAYAQDLAATEGARFMGRVAPHELARALAEAELMLYPNVGHETFCMAALEAQAAGCVVVCRDYSGIATTVADGCGIRIPGAAIDDDWRQRAAAEAIALLATDQARLAELRERAIAWARPQTWSRRVVEDWIPRILASDRAVPRG